MIRSMLVAAAAVASLLVLPACGPTCGTACSRQAECDKKLGSSSITNVEKCTKDCEENTSCKNKGPMLECLSNIQCDTEIGYLGELFGCAGKCSSSAN
jgi:hypothetical protein